MSYCVGWEMLLLEFWKKKKFRNDDSLLPFASSFCFYFSFLFIHNYYYFPNEWDFNLLSLVVFFFSIPKRRSALIPPDAEHLKMYILFFWWLHQFWCNKCRGYKLLLSMCKAGWAHKMSPPAGWDLWEFRLFKRCATGC